MSAFRGFIGEAIVHITLKLGLNTKEYRIFRDVIVPYPGGTSQIDNLVISKYGIFVIEVKNYTGWVFGNPNQKSWTQSIYGKKYHFQNPLIQNLGHIRTLKRCLVLSGEQFHSVVYFSGSGQLKTEMPSNVLNCGLIPHIRSYSLEILTMEEVLNCDALVQGFRKFNELSSRHHAKNVKALRRKST